MLNDTDFGKLGDSLGFQSLDRQGALLMTTCDLSPLAPCRLGLDDCLGHNLRVVCARLAAGDVAYEAVARGKTDIAIHKRARLKPRVPLGTPHCVPCQEQQRAAEKKQEQR
jgi:hypothetical protein